MSRIEALSSHAQYPANKIQNELGFVPKLTLNHGMAEMCRYWKNHI
jgi:nucleoside-diphosphate-sugar epimerase